MQHIQNKKNQEIEHEFLGVHVLGEMYGISFEKLNNQDLLEDALKRGITESGATLCSLQSKKFDPCGVTTLALLSESHASIHTYPEMGAIFFDAFTCGTTCRPERIAEALVAILEPTEHNLKTVKRGRF